MRFNCWFLRTAGDESWSDGEGGGAVNAIVPRSREAVKASALKAIIAMDGDSRPVVAWNVKGSNEHALVIATVGLAVSDSRHLN